MKWITECDGEGARAGGAKQGRVIRLPGVALVSSREHSGYRRAAGRNPCVSPPLGGDTSTTRCEGEFARQCRRHIMGDVLPCRSVGGAQVREPSINRVTVGDALQGCPKRE